MLFRSNRYLDSTGTVRQVSYERSGGFLGGLAADISGAITDLGPIATIGLNTIMPGLGTAVTVGNAIGSGADLGQVAGGLAASALMGNALSGTDLTPLEANAAQAAGTTLLTGGDVNQALNNAAFSAAGTGLSQAINSNTAPLSSTNDYSVNADYSLSSANPNLESMGGGQGLLYPSSPNLSDMGGGQGLVLQIGRAHV